MKLTEDLPFADPEAAARKPLDIVRASIAESGLPHACTGTTDTDFLRAGGSVDEYSAGMKSAAAQKNGSRSTDSGMTAAIALSVAAPLACSSLMVGARAANELARAAGCRSSLSQKLLFARRLGHNGGVFKIIARELHHET